MKKCYMDTSIIVASLMSAHPEHIRCAELIEQLIEEKHILITCTHSTAEIYSSLTKLPLKWRVSPTDCSNIIEEISKMWQIVELTKADYNAAHKRCAKLGLVSGIIYDALHVTAAEKAKADELYTLNHRDFKRLNIDPNIKYISF